MTLNMFKLINEGVYLPKKKKICMNHLAYVCGSWQKKKKNAVDVLASIAVIIRYKIKWTTATQQSVHH